MVAEPQVSFDGACDTFEQSKMDETSTTTVQSRLSPRSHRKARRLVRDVKDREATRKAELDEMFSGAPLTLSQIQAK